MDLIRTGYGINMQKVTGGTDASVTERLELYTVTTSEKTRYIKNSLYFVFLKSGLPGLCAGSANNHQIDNSKHRDSC